MTEVQYRPARARPSATRLLVTTVLITAVIVVQVVTSLAWDLSADHVGMRREQAIMFPLLGFAAGWVACAWWAERKRVTAGRSLS